MTFSSCGKRPLHCLVVTVRANALLISGAFPPPVGSKGFGIMHERGITCVNYPFGKISYLSASQKVNSPSPFSVLAGKLFAKTNGCLQCRGRKLSANRDASLSGWTANNNLRLLIKILASGTNSPPSHRLGRSLKV